MRILRSFRTLTAAFVLASPLFSGIAEETAPDQTKNASTEHEKPQTVPQATDVEKWVRQLGAAEYDARAQAFRELGALLPAAWPLLEPHLKSEDLDVVTQIRQLARDFGIFRADQQETVRRLLAKLESEDKNERCAALNDLLNFGPPSTVVLKKAFSGEGAKAELKLETEQRSIACGQKCAFKSTLVNAGKGMLWLEPFPRHSSKGFSTRVVETFGEPRLTCIGLGGCSMGMIRHSCGGRGGYVNPMLYWQPLKPGQAVAPEEESYEISAIGLIELNFSKTLHGGEITAQVPDTQNEQKFQMDAGLREEDLRAKGSLRIFVLPDLKEDDDRLALEISAPEKSVPPSGKLNLTAGLRSRLKDAGVRLEKDLARWAWYAVVDEKGLPVKWGSWRSVTQAAEKETLAARTLGPRGAAEWPLAITMPEKPGTYALYFGFEGDDGKTTIVGEEHPDFDAASVAGDAKALGLTEEQMVYFREGKVYARVEEVRVEKK